jgi:hypothetical protein
VVVTIVVLTLVSMTCTIALLGVAWKGDRQLRQARGNWWGAVQVLHHLVFLDDTGAVTLPVDVKRQAQKEINRLPRGDRVEMDVAHDWAQYRPTG